MRKKIFAFLLLSALYAGAQEAPDWENPIVVGKIGRAVQQDAETDL